ncbi:MAG: ABC transporter substrate-binding protein, partial [Christensenellales bacterium]
GNDGQDIDIYMPDGAPALAMSKLMYDNSQFGLDVNYNVVASSNISNYILQKTADLAILPINMASKILNDGQDYKIISTVTNGNLYIVGNQDISSLADLTNQVVGIIGQGNVPDLNFKYLLNSNGISYTQSEEKVDGQVALRYFSDASNLLPLLKQNQLNFGLLPEPAVSKLLSMASNFNVELDIQELWEGGSYPQAVLVAKTDICKNTTLINNMITAMKENELWVINNPSLAVDAVNSHLEEGLVASLQNTISSTAIANCNIKVVCTTEIGEINRMKSYLEKIRSVSSLAIGNYTDNLFYAL